MLLINKSTKSLIFTLGLWSLFAAPNVRAEQTYFDKNETAKSIEMQYRWKDYSGTHRSLSFELDKSKITKRPKTSRGYRPEIAQRYVYIELQRAAQKINPKEARVNFIRRGEEWSIEVRSDSDEIRTKWLNELRKTRESAFQQYLSDNYYSRYESPYGQRGVKPDHTRFVSESMAALLPAAQALYEQLDEDSTSRAYVNLILSWVQSIPYSMLKDRITSNGSGYLPPSEVVITNQGDCDSKAILTAALLRSLLPNLDMVVVYLPNHALLAANLPHFEEESKISVQGIEYLLLDPTGPALMKIGQISENTARFINGKLYRLEKLPGQIN